MGTHQAVSGSNVLLGLMYGCEKGLKKNKKNNTSLELLSGCYLLLEIVGGRLCPVGQVMTCDEGKKTETATAKLSEKLQICGFGGHG